jgi:hypothetical protein
MLLKALLAANFATSLFATVTFENEVRWILADAREGPVEACSRHNLSPLSTNLIQWDPIVMSSVVTDVLGRNISSAAALSSGLEGCCVGGLWCDASGCFTQGFGTFINHGWLNNDSLSVPVYTCSSNVTFNQSAIPANNRNTDASIRTTSKFLIIDGLDLSGYPPETPSVFLHGEACKDVQLNKHYYCTEDTNQCPLGMQCHAPDSSRGCKILCIAFDDQSCPVGHLCMSDVTAASGFACLRGQDLYDTITCSAQRTWQYPLLDNSSFSVEMQHTTYNIQHTTYNTRPEESMGNLLIDISSSGYVGKFSTSPDCVHDKDCFDGSLCTTDTCDVRTRQCVYVNVDGCSSVLQGIIDRTAPYMYYTFQLPSSSQLYRYREKR